MNPNQFLRYGRDSLKLIKGLQACLSVDSSGAGISQQGPQQAYKSPVCIGEVRGQQDAKEALLVAAAGGHNVLMIGPPGEGKSFLASTLPGFLPPPSQNDIQTLQQTYSLAGQALPADAQGTLIRPFRAVGPTITLASLIGGGRSQPIPGEMALAHAGILFLDEMPQFGRNLLDSLRQPLEDGKLSITRNGQTFTFPCRVQLIAAMNPCPCGYAGTPNCVCPVAKIQAYQSIISGPILDRIDIVTRLDTISSQQRFSAAIPNQSKQFLVKVLQAQSLALRYRGMLNSGLGPKQILGTSYYVAPDRMTVPKEQATGKPFIANIAWTQSGLRYLQIESDKAGYSTRRVVRLSRVARTIADLYNSFGIQPIHVHKALSFVNV